MGDERPEAMEISVERARQGVTGHNVRYVLVVSIALVVIGFLAVALLMRP